jgi:hypothetical protein
MKIMKALQDNSNATTLRILLISGIVALASGLAMFPVLLPVVAFIVLLRWRAGRRRSSTYGSATLATRADFESAGMLNDKGFILGRALPERFPLRFGMVLDLFRLPWSQSQRACSNLLATVFRAFSGQPLLRLQRYVHDGASHRLSASQALRQGESEALHRLRLPAFLRYGRSGERRSRCPSSRLAGAFRDSDAPQALCPSRCKSKGVAGRSRQGSLAQRMGERRTANGTHHKNVVRSFAVRLAFWHRGSRHQPAYLQTAVDTPPAAAYPARWRRGGRDTPWESDLRWH